MKLPNVKPQNLIAAAALVTPILLVQTVRIVFGGGPSQASAETQAQQPGPTAPQAPAPPATAAALTRQQKSAAEHLVSLRSAVSIYTSPFNHLAPQGAVVQIEPTTETVPDAPHPQAPIPAEVRSLTLGAVMSNDQGPIALIGGKVRSIGDVVIPGWTVSAIDPDARRVTLTSDDGASVTLTQTR